MNKLARLAAAAAALLVLAAAACSPALASPPIEVLQAAPAAARILNNSGTYTNGLQVVQFDIVPGGTAIVDTGFDFNAGDVVLDAWMVVSTAETDRDAGAADETLDFGLRTSVDAGEVVDGFADGISTIATGPVMPAVTITTGGHTKYASASTLGSLLVDYQAGGDQADAGSGTDLQAWKGDEGVAVRKRYVVPSTRRELVYKRIATHTLLQARGYVLFWRAP